MRVWFINDISCSLDLEFFFNRQGVETREFQGESDGQGDHASEVCRWRVAGWTSRLNGKMLSCDFIVMLVGSSSRGGIPGDTWKYRLSGGLRENQEARKWTHELQGTTRLV